MLVLNIRLKGKGALSAFLVSGATTPYCVSAAPSAAPSISPTPASMSCAACGVARRGVARRGVARRGVVW
jgi:hypothetical protein